MNINIKKQDILNALLLVNNIIQSSGLNPILSNILFIVNNDTIDLIGANDSVAIKTTTKNNTMNAKEEKMLINGELITKLIEKSNNDEISIDLVEEKVARIKSGRFTSNINLSNPDDYPRYDFDVSNKNRTQIKSEFINQIATKLLKVTNNKNSNVGKMFEGILLDTKIKPGTIVATGTDTFHLAAISDEYQGDNFRIIINQESIRLLNAQLKNKMVDLYIGNNDRILVKNDNITYNSKLIEGEYPSTLKITSVATESLTTNFTINKKDFINSVEKALLISTSEINKTNVIQIIVNENQIKISGQNIEKGNSYEEIGIVGKSEREATIILSATSLLNLLKNIDSGEVTFSYDNPSSPIYITDNKNKNYISLIMPTRN
ncbi:MAG: DNA polymerase III subunit beta [Mycoplasmataceae bacterium]|jgi:DNA polymerase III beta subunit|nr:DNA polymerase III subunit beta [Mycoplasmataceae bacterium]